MEEKVLSFYGQLADHYHLMFEDWDRSIERQAKVLNPLIAAEIDRHPLKILDCACGIGTQALGFASYGHRMVGSDASRAAIHRAKQEAEKRGLEMSFHVSDMRSLAEITDRDFDVVAALDNALPHLAADELPSAVQAISSKLKSNGLFLASIRDYDALILQKPTIQEPAFYGRSGERRIVHQVWDWIDEARYTLHVYITTQSAERWTSHHFVSEYRCLLRNELSTVLQTIGFRDVRWLKPSESGFYQPIVLAKWL